MKQYLWSDVEKWFADLFHSKNKIEMLHDRWEWSKKVFIDKIKLKIQETGGLMKKWRL